ncbi:MAG TPA: GNAT family N-acetyltransferase [Ardenticatenaceae bacterium]|jgi:predicted acetyltransferase
MPFRAITRDEIPVLAELLSRSFRYDNAKTIERLSNDTHRYSFSDTYVYEDGERGPVAGLAMFERPISLNGGELRASLIASVSVPPEQRRRGYANKLLTGALEATRARETPLSLLFPYSIPFYNRLGYGIVQNAWQMEFPLGELMDFDDLHLVRRMTADDLPAMKRLYERMRLIYNGWMGRTDWEWQERLLDVPGTAEWPHRSEGVVVPGRDGELRAYLTYKLAPIAQGVRDRALSIQEWVNEDDESWRALAGFVAAQRAQGDFLRFVAPEGFPLAHALKERHTYRNRRETQFVFRDTVSVGAGMMGRIVHLEQALIQRHYPEQARGECVIRMRDDRLPANEEPLHFRVEDGRASATPAQPNGGGSLPTAAADVRTWSEIYAATLTPTDARRLARLEADDATVAFLTEAFDSGPWFIHQADWF